MGGSPENKGEEDQGILEKDALPHLRSAFSPILFRAKCGVHKNIKGRSYVRQCVLFIPFDT
jgi:hypothetical protein